MASGQNCMGRHLRCKSRWRRVDKLRLCGWGWGWEVYGNVTVELPEPFHANVTFWVADGIGRLRLGRQVSGLA